MCIKWARMRNITKHYITYHKCNQFYINQSSFCCIWRMKRNEKAFVPFLILRKINCLRTLKKKSLHKIENRRANISMCNICGSNESMKIIYIFFLSLPQSDLLMGFSFVVVCELIAAISISFCSHNLFRIVLYVATLPWM